MLNIMDLEQQLINEIEERQAKLDKVRGVSPKLQALEILLRDCRDSCNEFGMQELFLGVLGKFTAAPTPQPQPQNQNQNQNQNQTVLTDKETKIIRQELKIFLKYEGQRLNDATIKNLLIEKLEGLNKTNLLEEVNLDDKVNFLTEAKKLIDLLTPAAPTVSTVSSDKEEVKEEVKEEEGLNPLDAARSALVQNTINGSYGTVDRDGVLNDAVLVRYPNTTELTPLSNLKLISPAVITPTPKVEEEIKEEEGVSDMTPQELAMWDALLAAGFTATELSAMATDKDTLDGFNSINGTSLTALPIAELYEYTMGVGRIE
jgi:hypothetical protein